MKYISIHLRLIIKRLKILKTRFYILQTRLVLNGKMSNLNMSLLINLNKTSLFSSKWFILIRNGLKMIIWSEKVRLSCLQILKGNTETLPIDTHAISFNKFWLFHSYYDFSETVQVVSQSKKILSTLLFENILIN